MAATVIRVSCSVCGRQTSSTIAFLHAEHRDHYCCPRCDKTHSSLMSDKLMEWMDRYETTVIQLCPSLHGAIDWSVAVMYYRTETKPEIAAQDATRYMHRIPDNSDG